MLRKQIVWNGCANLVFIWIAVRRRLAGDLNKVITNEGLNESRAQSI